MHKFIAGTFSAVLSIVHLLAIVVYLGVIAAMNSGAIAVPPGATVAVMIGAPVAYILFAGVTSVLIRINQHLGKISKTLDNWPHPDLPDFYEDEDEPAVDKKPVQVRVEPTLRREPQVRSPS
jgi:hypothetical protein